MSHGSWLAVLALAAGACRLELDAGRNRDGLPFGPKNPVVIVDDQWQDDRLPEAAMALASAGALRIAGIVVHDTEYYRGLAALMTGWNGLLDVARASGMHDLPQLVSSDAGPLERPSDGVIESTRRPGSAGAAFLVEAARTLGSKTTPLVVVSGSGLTLIAEAYLSDPSIADRIIVAGAFAREDASGSLELLWFNSELDPWASFIVASRLRVVPFPPPSGLPAPTPEELLSRLPETPFRQWVVDKRRPPQYPDPYPAFEDGVALLAVAAPAYAAAVERGSWSGTLGAPIVFVADSVGMSSGSTWLITQRASAVALDAFWAAMTSPATYRPR